MSFDKWLDTFLEEKGIDLGKIIIVDGEYGANFIPVECVVEAMKATTKEEQAAIKNTLVRIDFMNGNVYHYFEHLAKALAN